MVLVRSAAVHNRHNIVLFIRSGDYDLAAEIPIGNLCSAVQALCVPSGQIDKVAGSYSTVNTTPPSKVKNIAVKPSSTSSLVTLEKSGTNSSGHFYSSSYSSGPADGTPQSRTMPPPCSFGISPSHREKMPLEP